MGDRIRVFIAIELPDRVRSDLARAVTGLRKERAPFRWVNPENIHLTLVFLGEVDKIFVDAIVTAISDTVCVYHPLQLVVKGLGVFPTIKRPRVLWAGVVEDVGDLRGLKAALDQRLSLIPGLAYTPGQRKFKAHLTLGRTRGRVDGRRLAESLVRVQARLLTRFTAKKVHLIQSKLHPDGAVYTRLHSARLENIESSHIGEKTTV